MLELQNLVWELPDGGSIINGISCKLGSRLTVITGPNGGGKTSLAKLIAGVEKPTSGRILLDGEDITDLDITGRARLGVAYAFQQPVRFKGLTVRDDGEPGGTAGVPIYEVLRKEGLTDVCCVVTRYFGGVLLGAGGLVRAYTRGAKDAVDAAQIKCMAEAVKLAVTVDYGLYGRLAQVFADFDARVEDERFADNVRIVLHIRAENSQKLTDKLVDVCNGAVSVEEIEKLNFDFA